jgi:hypothetical protein
MDHQKLTHRCGFQPRLYCDMRLWNTVHHLDSYFYQFISKMKIYTAARKVIDDFLWKCDGKITVLSRRLGESMSVGFPPTALFPANITCPDSYSASSAWLGNLAWVALFSTLAGLLYGFWINGALWLGWYKTDPLTKNPMRSLLHLWYLLESRSVWTQLVVWKSVNYRGYKKSWWHSIGVLPVLSDRSGKNRWSQTSYHNVNKCRDYNEDQGSPDNRQGN